LFGRVVGLGRSGAAAAAGCRVGAPSLSRHGKAYVVHDTLVALEALGSLEAKKLCLWSDWCARQVLVHLIGRLNMNMEQEQYKYLFAT